MKNFRAYVLKIGWTGFALWIAAAGAARPVWAAATAEVETGPNISGESTAEEHRQLFKEDSVRKDDNMRIDVPQQIRPDGRPQRPVRGLSRTEKQTLDDLEYRYQQGQISEAEYFSKRNEIMQRIGLEPEY